MKHLLLLLFINCIAVANNQAQSYAPKRPYEKLTFEGVAPTTYHTFRDADFNKLGSDGYNLFNYFKTAKPYIHNNLFFIIFHDGISQPGFFGTYYINCVNLDNGNLIWRQKIAYDEVKNIEIPRLLKVNEKEELVIIGQKKINEYFGEGVVDSLILFERRYSVKDGSFISLKHKPFDDPTTHVSQYQLLLESPFYEELPGKYRIIERIKKDSIYGYRSTLVDDVGAVVSGPDTILHTYIGDFVYNLNLMPIGKDSFLLAEVNYEPELPYRVYIALKLLNSRLEIQKEVSFLSPSQKALGTVTMKLLDFDSKTGWARFFIIEEGDPPLEDELIVISFVADLDGNLIKQTKQIEYGGFRNWASNDHSFFTINTKFHLYDDVEDRRTRFRSVECKDDFQYQVIKDVIVLDTMRAGGIVDIYSYKDHDVIFMTEGAYYINEFGNIRQDIFAIARSLITFKKGDFLPDGLFTTLSNQNNLIENRNITSYPNPSSGSFNIIINNVTEQTDIRFYDIMGRQVFEALDIHEGNISLDLSILELGTYIYKVYQGSMEIGTGKWIKIE
jgi:hypothetical protein